jgi:hypothetical protein
MREAGSPWRAFAVLAIGVFLSVLDLFIVNIAFPEIESSFPSASLSSLSWILSAYAIVLAAVLVPAGKLADIVGRKRVFRIDSPRYSSSKRPGGEQEAGLVEVGRMKALLRPRLQARAVKSPRATNNPATGAPAAAARRVAILPMPSERGVGGQRTRPRSLEPVDITRTPTAMSASFSARRGNGAHTGARPSYGPAFP